MHDVELMELMASLGRAMDDCEAQSMLQELDGNGDGCVSREEFLAWNKSQMAMRHGAGASDLEEMAHAIFNLFDDDNSGSITIKEFSEGLARFKIDLSSEDLTVLVTALDEDGSGDISIEEFVMLLKKFHP